MNNYGLEFSHRYYQRENKVRSFENRTVTLNVCHKKSFPVPASLVNQFIFFLGLNTRGMRPCLVLFFLVCFDLLVQWPFVMCKDMRRRPNKHQVNEFPLRALIHIAILTSKLLDYFWFLIFLLGRLLISISNVE